MFWQIKKRLQFFKKAKIRRRVFKKKKFLFFNFTKFFFFKRQYKYNTYKKYFLYNEYKKLLSLKLENGLTLKKNNTMCKNQNIFINFSQKKYTCNNNITYRKLIHTSTIGTIMRYLGIIQYKYLRRSLKGFKIFLNLIKIIYLKKFLKKKDVNLVFFLNGFNFKFNFFKKKINSYFETIDPSKQFYFLLNLKINFSKNREKKIKSIKKRIRKKILLSFKKNTINMKREAIFKKI